MIETMGWCTLIILTFIWRCPIFLISQQIGVFQNSKVKKRQLPIFFMGNWRFFTGNWRFFTFEFWKTPICCEIRKIGQRQIGVKIISVIHQVAPYGKWKCNNLGLPRLHWNVCVASDVIWNKFHAFHWNSFFPFFLLANGWHETHFKWHLMPPTRCNVTKA